MVALVIVGSGGAFYVRHVLTRRAVSTVIKILHRHNAIGPEGAQSLRELGLERPSFIKKTTSRRDYKQVAIQILIRQGVVHVNENGAVYLVENE
jgi:hypothetical protein